MFSNDPINSEIDEKQKFKNGKRWKMQKNLNARSKFSCNQ